MSKERIDELLSKWISKKLMVFLISTLLAIFGDLSSSDFVTIATIYIGTQGVVDAVTQLKGLRKNN